MTDGEPARQAPADAAERLLVEAAQRDPRRFADLYEEHFERVYAYVARRVGDRDVAQDLTADVFHQALANLPRFEWRGVPFAAWLFRIAANAIVDRAKRDSSGWSTACRVISAASSSCVSPSSSRSGPSRRCCGAARGR
jgi:RNA polymerase sigma-70 factor (ECF subfamily)